MASSDDQHGTRLTFRLLDRSEIERIWTIDRRELVERIYRLEGGELRLHPDYCDVPGWHPDTVRDTTPVLYTVFDRGGTFFAAFDGDQLAGLAVLDTVWRGPAGDLLQLEFMHVGRDYRAHGLGTRLFEQARDAARQRGAGGLYISATPTENTIHFYQGRGARVLLTPDPELFALEPEDIHFACPIKAPP